MALTFSAPLQTSIVPAIAAGDPTPSFTRATTATIIDHEGIVRTCASGEARFYGARRVRNFLQTSFAQEHGVGGWAAYAASTYSVTTGIDDPRGGTDARRVTLLTGATDSGFLAAIPGSPLYADGESGVASAWFRVPSGTLGIKLYSQGTDSVSTSLTIDTTWRRYSSAVADNGGKALYWIVGFDAGAGGVLDVFEPQLEKVSGQSNQAPAEYVSVGVLSAPYHGAGVDGVRYFATENGNSVAGNVVTEATGAAIADDTLKGYTAEGQRTNRCLYSEDFSNAAWVKTNCTISANSTEAPDGATTADTLTATAGNATVVQDLGVVASIRKVGSVYLKRKTGTGNVQLTMDGGAGWTTVAVDSTWTRFELIQVLADEDFGIRLVTNGDEVYAWGGQVESVFNVPTAAPELRSSYIATTSAAVTRNMDVLTYSSTTNASEGPLTTYVERSRPVAMYGSASAAAPPLSIGDYSGNAYLGCDVYGEAGNILTSWPTVWGLVLNNNFSTAVNQIYKTAVTLAADGRTVNYYLDGAQTGGSSGVSADTKSANWAGAKIYVGTNNSANDHYHCIRNIRLWNKVMPISAGGVPVTTSRGGSVTQLSQYYGMVAVTPHDTTQNIFNGWTVSVDGNVKITDSLGNANTVPCYAGIIYPIKTKLIWSTGTTATGILGLV